MDLNSASDRLEVRPVHLRHHASFSRGGVNGDKQGILGNGARIISSREDEMVDVNEDTLTPRPALLRTNSEKVFGNAMRHSTIPTHHV